MLPHLRGGGTVSDNNSITETQTQQSASSTTSTQQSSPQVSSTSSETPAQNTSTPENQQAKLQGAVNPTIVDPVSAFLDAGTTQAFTSSIDIAGATLQWQYLLPGTTTWQNYAAGGTKSPLTIAAATFPNDAKLRVVFTDPTTKNTYTSGEADFISGRITTQPATQYVDVGAPATFSVASNVPNGTVQWQVSTDNGSTFSNLADGSGISGSTTNNLQVTAPDGTWNSRQYRAIITNPASSKTYTSTTGTLVLTSSGGTIVDPVSAFVDQSRVHNFTSSIDIPNATVQWQFLLPGSSVWQNSANATSTTFAVVGSTFPNGAQIRAVFTDPATGLLHISNPAEVTSGKITTQPTNQSVDVGNTASFNVAVNFSNARVRWQGQDSTGTWVDLRDDGATISGAWTDTLNITAADPSWNFKKYRATIINEDSGAQYTSATAELFLNGQAVQPQNAYIDFGQTTALTAASGIANTKTLWYQKLAGGSWTPLTITNEKLDIITAPLALDQAQFKAVYTLPDGSTQESDVATLTVGHVTVQPKNQQTPDGQNATFSVDSNIANPTYQWQTDSGDGTWTNINDDSTYSGTTSKNLTVTATATIHRYKYRAVITNSVSNVSQESSGAILNISGINVDPTDISVKHGTQVSFYASNSDPDATVQWQYSTKDKPDTFINISGAKSNEFIIAAASGTQNDQHYRAVFTHKDNTTTITSAAKLSVSDGVTMRLLRFYANWSLRFEITNNVGGNIIIRDKVSGKEYFHGPTNKYLIDILDADKTGLFESLAAGNIELVQAESGTTTSVTSANSACSFPTSVQRVVDNGDGTVSVTLQGTGKQPVTVVDPTGQLQKYYTQDNPINPNGTGDAIVVLPKANWQDYKVYQGLPNFTASAPTRIEDLGVRGLDAPTAWFTPGDSGQTGSLKVSVAEANAGNTLKFYDKATGLPISWLPDALVPPSGVVSVSTPSNINPTQVGIYQVNSEGLESNENIVELAAQNMAPTIIEQPTDVHVVNGATGDSATVMFSSDGIGVPTPSIQWQSFDGENWNDIDGATDRTLSVENANTLDGTKYRAVYTNDAGETTTNEVSIIVDSANLNVPVEATENTTVTITGDSFTHNSDVQVKVLLPTGEQRSYTTTSDDSGNISLDIPGLPTGLMQITAIDAEGHTASGSMNVVKAVDDPDLTVPGSVSADTDFTITGGGYTPNGQVNIDVTNPDGTKKTVTLTADANGTISYTVPGASAGTMQITATDQTTGKSVTQSVSVTAPVTPASMSAPSTVKTGDKFTVTGKDFTPGDTLTLNATMNGKTVKTFTGTVAADGTISIDIDGLDAGTYLLTMLDQHSKSAAAALTVESKDAPTPTPTPSPSGGGSNPTPSGSGTNGTNGSNGSDGANGSNGNSGSDGANGLSGGTGSNGTSGIAGLSGANGSSTSAFGSNSGAGTDAFGQQGSSSSSSPLAYTGLSDLPQIITGLAALVAAAGSTIWIARRKKKTN